jgi:chaperone modulatory protein CbpM
MIALDELIRLAGGGVDRAEIERWVRLGWVAPEPGQGGYVFRQVDVARVRLIAEIRRDCDIDEETMPVVLRLLDQVYTLRRGMREILEALAEQPEDVRQAVASSLSRRHADETTGG